MNPNIHKFHAIAIKLAIETVNIPLSVFMHAIVKYFALCKINTGANQSCFYETTLELIQYASVARLSALLSTKSKLEIAIFVNYTAESVKAILVGREQCFKCWQGSICHSTPLRLGTSN